MLWHPHGSIPGPTLSQIFVNYLCTMQLPNTSIFTYADDNDLFVWGADWEIVKGKAEHSFPELRTS